MPNYTGGNRLGEGIASGMKDASRAIFDALMYRAKTRHQEELQAERLAPAYYEFVKGKGSQVGSQVGAAAGPGVPGDAAPAPDAAAKAFMDLMAKGDLNPRQIGGDPEAAKGIMEILQKEGVGADPGISEDKANEENKRRFFASIEKFRGERPEEERRAAFAKSMGFDVPLAGPMAGTQEEDRLKTEAAAQQAGIPLPGESFGLRRFRDTMAKAAPEYELRPAQEGNTNPYEIKFQPSSVEPRAGRGPVDLGPLMERFPAIEARKDTEEETARLRAQRPAFALPPDPSRQQADKLKGLLRERAIKEKVVGFEITKAQSILAGSQSLDARRAAAERLLGAIQGISRDNDEIRSLDPSFAPSSPSLAPAAMEMISKLLPGAAPTPAAAPAAPAPDGALSPGETPQQYFFRTGKKLPPR
mgnify:CR=1 FL=1